MRRAMVLNFLMENFEIVGSIVKEVAHLFL